MVGYIVVREAIFGKVFCWKRKLLDKSMGIKKKTLLHLSYQGHKVTERVRRYILPYFLLVKEHSCQETVSVSLSLPQPSKNLVMSALRSSATCSLVHVFGRIGTVELGLIEP